MGDNFICLGCPALLASPPPPNYAPTPACILRDSKFTRLIADTLGGYSNTVMVACLAPGGSREEETLTTVRYSQLASRILNKPQARWARTFRACLRGFRLHDLVVFARKPSLVLSPRGSR
jgi:hypothetical protein